MQRLRGFVVSTLRMKLKLQHNFKLLNFKPLND